MNHSGSCASARLRTGETVSGRTRTSTRRHDVLVTSATRIAHRIGKVGEDSSREAAMRATDVAGNITRRDSSTEGFGTSASRLTRETTKTSGLSTGDAQRHSTGPQLGGDAAQQQRAVAPRRTPNATKKPMYPKAQR